MCIRDSNQSWKNLQEFDLELSGDTFWFLVPDSLLEATVVYKNVNVEQQYSTIRDVYKRQQENRHEYKQKRP